VKAFPFIYRKEHEIVKNGEIVTLTKGKKEVKATFKAYNSVFKNLGYSIKGDDVAEQENTDPKDTALNYDDMTKKEIIADLKELNVKFNQSDDKKELFDLLQSELNK
jgi:hypothetical protein